MSCVTKARASWGWLTPFITSAKARSKAVTVVAAEGHDRSMELGRGRHAQIGLQVRVLQILRDDLRFQVSRDPTGRTGQDGRALGIGGEKLDEFPSQVGFLRARHDADRNADRPAAYPGRIRRTAVFLIRLGAYAEWNVGMVVEPAGEGFRHGKAHGLATVGEVELGRLRGLSSLGRPACSTKSLFHTSAKLGSTFSGKAYIVPSQNISFQEPGTKSSGLTSLLATY